MLKIRPVQINSDLNAEKTINFNFMAIDQHLNASVYDKATINSTFLKLDQSTAQTIYGGVPVFSSGLSSGDQIISTVATGASPLSIVSTTLNTNLNADLWDGYQFSDYLNQAVKTTSSPTFVGLTLSTMTLGSVLFAGAAGVISQDNSNFFWDNNNKRLGIGTTSPTAQFEIYKNPGSASVYEAIRLKSISNLDGYGSRINFYNDAVNGAAIECVRSNTEGNSKLLKIYGSTGNDLYEWITIGNNKTIISMGTVGIIETSPLARLHVSTGADASIGQIIKGYSASQSGDLLQFRNSASATLTLFDASGYLAVGGKPVTSSGTQTKLWVRGDYTGGTDSQLLICGNTDSNKRLRIGYDTTLNAGYIQATIIGTGNSSLLLNNSGGNVGITAQTPASKLHVGGNTIIGNATALSSGAGLYLASQTSGVLELCNGTASGADTHFSDLILSHLQNGSANLIGRIPFVNRNSASSDKRLAQISVVTDGATNSGALLISTNTAGTFSDAIRITSTGRLKLARASNEWLYSDGSLRIDIDNNNDQTDRIFVISKDNAGTELMRVQENGNVGINDTTPYSKFVTTISSNSTSLSATANCIQAYNSDTTVNNMSGIMFSQNNGSSTYLGAAIVGVHTKRNAGDRDTELAFYTMDGSVITERMRLDIGGNLLLNNVDSQALKLGAGTDMSIYYDGTNGNIDTDLVAPSDLIIDCGTDKTVVLEETVYNDANVGSLVLVTGGTLPGVVEILDNTGAATGIYTRGFAVGEQGSGSIEIPHDYKEGTDLSFHIHWMGQDAPTGTDNVKWQVTYTITRSGSTTAPVTTDSNETSIDTQYKWYFTVAETVTGTNLKIGDQVNFTVSRIASVGDAYAGEALVATMGFHYECDTLGSRQISTK